MVRIEEEESAAAVGSSEVPFRVEAGDFAGQSWDA